MKKDCYETLRMDRSIYGIIHGSHRSLVDPYAVYGQQDEDSMYLQQVQGLQNLGYSQSLDGLHPLDYASRSAEMELAERELAEVERIRLLRLQQLQEAEKMRQMDELQHMYHRNMSLGTLNPSISARNMSMYGNLEPIASHRPMDRAMNQYSSELECIDQPHFDRRALPEYYTSTRTVDERKKKSSDRSRRSGRSRRSRSHGRLRSRSERRSDRHERDRHDHRRRRSSTPSRSRRRDDPSSDEETVSSLSRAGRRSSSRNQRSSSRSPVKSSSRRPSRPNLPRSGGKGNSTSRRSKSMPRRSKNEDTSDESESDESWNKIGSTRDLIKGLKTEDSWLQQASDVVKGTINVVLNGPSDESSSEDSSSDDDSDDSDESK